MKAHQATTPPAFVPVILTLESQAEVDGIFALLRSSFLLAATKLNNTGFEALRPLVNHENSDELFKVINRIVKNPSL